MFNKKISFNYWDGNMKGTHLVGALYERFNLPIKIILLKKLFKRAELNLAGVAQW